MADVHTLEQEADTGPKRPIPLTILVYLLPVLAAWNIYTWLLGGFLSNPMRWDWSTALLFVLHIVLPIVLTVLILRRNPIARWVTPLFIVGAPVLIKVMFYYTIVWMNGEMEREAAAQGAQATTTVNPAQILGLDTPAGIGLHAALLVLFLAWGWSISLTRKARAYYA